MLPGLLVLAVKIAPDVLALHYLLDSRVKQASNIQPVEFALESLEPMLVVRSLTAIPFDSEQD